MWHILRVLIRLDTLNFKRFIDIWLVNQNRVKWKYTFNMHNTIKNKSLLISDILHFTYQFEILKATAPIFSIGYI